MKSARPKHASASLVSAPTAAFTIIEMLVSVSIMILLFSSAMAAYTRYSDKQALALAAEGLEAVLLDAQNKAKTGYLGPCSQVSSIGVASSLEDETSKYRVLVHCAQAEGDFPLTTDVDDGVYELGKNLRFDPHFEIRFSPLGSIEIRDGTDQLVNELAVKISSTKQSQSTVIFHLNRGGEIKATY